MKIEYTEKLTKEYNEKCGACFVLDIKEKGIDPYYEKFVFILKNDNGEIVGGINFWVVYEAVYIDDLWIEKPYRGKGYGKKLLEKVWNKFKDKGYDHINLTTREFQAPEFYKKCGYELDFVKKHKNSKLNRYFFIKRFNDIKEER